MPTLAVPGLYGSKLVAAWIANIRATLTTCEVCTSDPASPKASWNALCVTLPGTIGQFTRSCSHATATWPPAFEDEFAGMTIEAISVGQFGGDSRAPAPRARRCADEFTTSPPH